MINLLPQQYKTELKTEEKKRMVIIIGSIALVGLISLNLILMAVEIHLSGQIEAQKKIFEETRINLESASNRKLESDVKAINKNLANLQGFYGKSIDFTKLIEKISENLSKGVYLTDLAINPISKPGEAKASCQLAGIAKDRESLIEFKENLEKEEMFESVYLHPKYLIDPEKFNLNFTIK